MRLLYTGDASRYYPTLGLTPAPGTVYELPEDPGDGRWAPEEKPVKKASAAPQKKEVSDA
ncbi:hypothetical protein [Streptomyces sp. MUM 16J]|uniref:hypothetical protein n=1 Tax=Streptomyces sp. MUM 16J TaxID=2791988 RepID=UPI001F037FBA|nr:hypothetical protein [Streptomyces sp. MUM 16J]MCH0555815.1 hypothetical protein [Streptomyces sp. MUM 16J]